MTELYKNKKFIKVDNINLCYSVHGESDNVLLFLHGMGSNIAAWSKNIPVLSRNAKCIAIDFPGYGETEKGTDPSDVHRDAGLVIKFIEQLSLSKVTLVGHSMGGLVGTLVAKAIPEKIASLVLVAPAGIEVFSQGEVELIKTYFTGELIASYSTKMISKNFELNFYEMPEDARFMIRDRQERSKNADDNLVFCNTMAESTASLVQTNIGPILEELELPILLFFGDSDKLIPHHIVHPDRTTLEIAEATEKRMKNGQLVFFSKCGHFVQWEKSEEVNKHISNLITVSAT